VALDRVVRRGRRDEFGGGARLDAAAGVAHDEVVPLTPHPSDPGPLTAMTRVAVVTGASHGIGAGLVSAFRGLGYSVVATSRSIDDPTTRRGDRTR